MSNASQSLARTAPPALIAVAGLTVLGFVLRAAQFDQSLFADELSTYWIVNDHNLGEVLDSVRSNDEITPPLYFALGWLSLKLGPDPEWVRLPSLLAGTAAIPLVYLLGVRTLGRGAGLIGAAVMTLSPFMIYYSVEARSYALMIALVTASTVAMLAAIDSRRARWWVAYALCSCGALLSHYTSVFPLAAQLAWALWAHREAIRSLLLANLGVVAGFAPWIPGFIDDNNSPTTEILSALQPFTLDAVRFALEAWAVGYPAYVRLETVPGHVGGVLIAVGLLAATTAGAVRLWQSRRRSSLSSCVAMRRIPPRIVLVALLALATPIGEAVYSALSTNLLAARNLNASWPGLAVAIGALVSAAGPLLGIVCAALVLSGFTIGAARTLDSDLARVDYAAAAGVIEERWAPGDVVVDAAALTPVPLTGLDVYLPQNHPEFRLDLPVSENPFMLGDPVPAPDRLIAKALAAGDGGSIFLVTPPKFDLASPTRAVAEQQRDKRRLGARLLRRAPPDFDVAYRRTLPRLGPLEVVEIEDRGGAP